MNKTLRLNNLATGTAMNAEISVFVTCVEAIVYFILYNLHDCAFKCFIIKIQSAGLPVVGILFHELPQPGIDNYTQVSNYHMLVIWMTKLRMF